MKKSLEDYAHQHNISLTTFSAKLKARNLKTVCKTFHKAGLVVPFDRKTDVGYRQLAESDGNFYKFTVNHANFLISLCNQFIPANLKKILNKIPEAKGDKDLLASALDKLEPLITAANICKSNYIAIWYRISIKSNKSE